MGDIQFEDSKILFDSGQIAFDQACCCEGVPCPNCQSGFLPLTITVTFSGVANDPNPTFPCTLCDLGFNKTHILEIAIPAAICEWIIGIVACYPISASTIRASVTFESGDYILNVFTNEHGSSGALYQKNLGPTKPDCTAFNETLTLTSVVQIGVWCSWPPTCTAAS